MNAKQVEDMGKNLHSILKSKAARFEMYSIAVDESFDSENNIRLMVFIRGINSSFEITEELAAMKSVPSSATVEDVFQEVSDIIQDYGLPWNKLVGVTTNGGLRVMGNYNALAGKISGRVAESNAERPLRLQCIIDPESVFIKVLNLDHVISTVVSTVNFIKTQASNHRIYNELFTDIESEYEEVYSEDEVCWLGEGLLIRRFFDLRHEINIFMKQKSGPVEELKDFEWLWDFAFLCDIMPHLNEFISKIQRKEELVSHLYADVIDFQAKLELLITQVKNSTLLLFPTCLALRSEGELPMFFPKARLTQLLRRLRANFNDRFIEFNNWKDSIRLFENPFTANVSRYPNELQIELVNLQKQKALYEKFRFMEADDFYSGLPAGTFPNLRHLGLKMIAMFTSIHVYEEAITIMKRTRCALQDRLTNEHLDSVIRTGISSLQSEIETLASKSPTTTEREESSEENMTTIKKGVVDSNNSVTSKIVGVVKPVVNWRQNYRNSAQKTERYEDSW